MRSSNITNEEYREIAMKTLLNFVDAIEKSLPETLTEYVDYGKDEVSYESGKCIREEIQAVRDSLESNLDSLALEYALSTIWKLIPFIQSEVHRKWTEDTNRMEYMFGDKSQSYYGDELFFMTGPAHCDNRVLHAPKVCPFCDHNEEAQKYREDHNINFTGEKNPTKRPCPAELERGDICQYWPGNRPEGYQGYEFLDIPLED